MEVGKPKKRSIRDHFPLDFPERLGRFRNLAGLSWKELAACLGVRYGRVMGWRRGVVPQGFALLDLMRLARRVPAGWRRCFPASWRP